MIITYEQLQKAGAPDYLLDAFADRFGGHYPPLGVEFKVGGQVEVENCRKRPFFNWTPIAELLLTGPARSAYMAAVNAATDESSRRREAAEKQRAQAAQAAQSCFDANVIAAYRKFEETMEAASIWNLASEEGRREYNWAEDAAVAARRKAVREAASARDSAIREAAELRDEAEEKSAREWADQTAEAFASAYIGGSLPAARTPLASDLVRAIEGGF